MVATLQVSLSARNLASANLRSRVHGATWTELNQHVTIPEMYFPLLPKPKCAEYVMCLLGRSS